MDMQQAGAALAIPQRATPLASMRSGKLFSVEENPCLTPTIFHQPWWLNIATRGQHQVVEVKRDGRVVGRLAFHIGKRYGHTVCLMPPLTHFLGPAIDEGVGGANARFLQRMTITHELLAQLPSIAYFKQKLHRGVADTLPFQMAGYQSSVQFTHEIAPQPEPDIWQALRDKTRNMVRKARRAMVCETLDDPDAFIRLYVKNLEAKNVPSAIDLSTCRDLIAACLARNCGRIHVARLPDGAVAAAIFFAWDQTAGYYLLSTRTPNSGNSANTLILWEAIRVVTSRGLIFDFDGVGSAGAVLFFAGFGAVVQPRYIVSRSGKLAQLLQDVRVLVGYDRSTFY